MRIPGLALLVAVGCTADPDPSDEGLSLLLETSEVDCGALVFDNGATACPAADAALACFQDASAPRVSQLMTTDEGDVIYHYFVKENGQLVYIRDTRQDAFGPQEVTRETCDAVQLADSGCPFLTCVLDK